MFYPKTGNCQTATQTRRPVVNKGASLLMNEACEHSIIESNHYEDGKPLGCLRDDDDVLMKDIVGDEVERPRTKYITCAKTYKTRSLRHTSQPLNNPSIDLSQGRQKMYVVAEPRKWGLSEPLVR